MSGVRVRLTFPEDLVTEPLLAQMTRSFGVDPNIRRADLEEHQGWIVCELDGSAPDVEEALRWLRERGVRVDLLGDLLEG